MTEFLLMHLYAPLQAWGGVAVGEVRTGEARPTKSGVLGLVAAALGLDRGAEEAHLALEAALGFAVRVDRPGRPLSDYHTIQMPKAAKRPWAHRRDELMRGDVVTMLTTRDYLADACFTAALWVRETHRMQPPYSLDQIDQALRTPHYLPYLGRKSCPPAWPLVPSRVTADSVQAAFRAVPLPDGLKERVRPAAEVMVYWEPGADEAVTGPVYLRRDRFTSRRRRSFESRREVEGLLQMEEI